MKNFERPGRPPAASSRHRGASAPSDRGNDVIPLALVDERTEKERGYDPYDTARRPDVWRHQRRRA